MKIFLFLFLYIEPIAGTPPSQSLDDITLEEDIDLEQQLNDFLQNEPLEASSGDGVSPTKETSENVENKEQSWPNGKASPRNKRNN